MLILSALFCWCYHVSFRFSVLIKLYEARGFLDCRQHNPIRWINEDKRKLYRTNVINASIAILFPSSCENSSNCPKATKSGKLEFSSEIFVSNSLPRVRNCLSNIYQAINHKFPFSWVDCCILGQKTPTMKFWCATRCQSTFTSDVTTSE